jgi:hypothetical protein
MDAAQQKALQAGRARAERERRRAGIRRVVVFERWLAVGSKLRDIPEIPTDADYALARAAGKIKREQQRTEVV